jgi:hypothetical protein
MFDIESVDHRRRSNSLMNLTVWSVTALAGRLGYASGTRSLIARPSGTAPGPWPGPRQPARRLSARYMDFPMADIGLDNCYRPR